jgi:tetratricopeptide (TPR) repeat protein
MASRRSPRRPRPPSRPAPVASRIPSWAWPITLAVLTFAAYQPAWRGGLLWDDDAHLIPPLLSSWSGLGRILTDFTATQQYYPVANSAFWLMNRLWGHDPLGYHLVNITLHLVSAWLVFGILRRWSVPGATLAATVFALHPVHVESVAWMTELKNTLSGVFYLLAVRFYLRFDETRAWSSYTLALVAFALALGSKTVTATMPVVLLVIFWWQRGTLNWRRDVFPVLPFVALGVAAGLGTAWLEYAWVGAKGESFDLTLIERTLLAGRAVWFYATKIVWPIPLIFMYPRWEIDQSVWWQYLFPIGVAGALVAGWMLRHRSRAPLAAALFFCGTLFPAVGFVNVFPFRYSFVADHFQYLASLGPIVALSAALALTFRRRWPGGSEWTLAAVVAVPLFLLTHAQSRQYVSAEVLYRATIAANPDSLLARNNLSALLLDGPSEGWPEAERQALEAVRIAPDDASAHNNLGLAWMRGGRYEDSVREHREAIRLNPQLAPAYYNLGLSLAELGKPEEAMAAYEESLRIFPRQPEVLHNLSKVLLSEGRFEDALQRAREAVAMAPESPDVRMSLGNALQAAGATDDAIAAYREALRLRPGWGEVLHNLATALRRMGRLDEAVAAYAEAERALPDSALIQISFGSLLLSLDRPAEAIAHFERAIPNADPRQLPDLHNQLGVLLAGQGQLQQAAAHFEEALRLRPEFAAARANLARIRR